MPKSVLISEWMPECCKCCIFEQYHDRFKYYYCMVEHNLRQIDDESVRSDWCPIKMIPDKLSRGKFEAEDTTTSYMNGIADGWNALLDYMEGNNGKTNETQ